jgi:hypothetical protein
VKRALMIVLLSCAPLACLEDVDDGHPAPDRDVAPDGGTFDPNSIQRGGGGSSYGGSGSGVQGSGVQGSGSGGAVRAPDAPVAPDAGPDAAGDASVDGALG